MKGMFGKWMGWLLVLALATVGVNAQRLPEIKFEKYELPNGLDVILHEDHSLPMVTVNIWYKVGSGYEKPGRTGFAHLFEHMMFQGTEHYDDDYFVPIETAGGDLNGSTEEDRTNYWETVPSNYLDMALWMESDRMGYLLPAMTQEKMDNQRDVVKNERRQGVENQPYGKAEELLRAMVYPPGHPYSWSGIGSMADLSAATLEDVKDFFRQFYTPNNASLCIAGDFDPAMARTLVEKYFASIPAGPNVDRLEVWEAKLDGIKRMVAQDNVPLPRLYMYWISPPLYAPGDAELDLFASIMGAGKNSRLYKTLVYDRQIAQDILIGQESMGIASDFYIIATARPGRTLEEIEQAIDEEIRKILAEGVTPGEFARAKTQYEASYVRGLEPVGDFYGRADRLNAYNTQLGDPNKFQWDLDRYNTSTVEKMMEAARTTLDLNRRAILYIVPRGDLTATAAADKGTLPSPAAEPAFTPPTPQKEILANGLTLYVVEDHTLPLVQFNLRFKSGWAVDPATTPGVAALTTDMLDEGTKTRTALQISEAARDLGAALFTSSGYSSSSVALNVLTKNLDPGLGLMADIILTPAFSENELERLRKMYLGRIVQEKGQPASLGMRAFNKQLYGVGHPYAQPASGIGTEATINAITRNDLVAFYEANFVPNNAVIAVVGDITLAEAKTKLEKTFQNWKSRPVTLPIVPAPPPLTKTKIYIVDKPGAAQSQVYAGCVGFPNNSPDFTPFMAMNNALGGQFTSRINMNLREDKGFTYGARSLLSARRGPGPFYCSAPVQSQSTKETVFEIIKEFRDIENSRPLSQEELDKSKENLIKVFPLEFVSIQNIASNISANFTNDIPDNDWQTFISDVKAVDVAKATAVARKYINPDALLIVVVGDKAKIEQGLKELNVGEVETIDPATL